MAILRYLMLVCCLLSLTNIVMAARGPEFIEKELVLGQACSDSLQKALGVDKTDLIRGIQFPVAVTGMVTNPALNDVSNEIKLIDSGLLLKGYWSDLTGAIPRRAGPRFVATMEAVESITELAGFWNLLFQVLGLTEDTVKKLPDAYPLASREICANGHEGVVVSLYLRKGFSNQYGSEPDRYLLTLAVGEHVAEIANSNR